MNWAEHLNEDWRTFNPRVAAAVPALLAGRSLPASTAELVDLLYPCQTIGGMHKRVREKLYAALLGAHRDSGLATHDLAAYARQSSPVTKRARGPDGHWYMKTSRPWYWSANWPKPTHCDKCGQRLPELSEL